MTSVSAPVGFARWADDESQPGMSVGRRHRYWVRGFVAEFGLSVETMALMGLSGAWRVAPTDGRPRVERDAMSARILHRASAGRRVHRMGMSLLSASSVFLHLANISVVGYEVSGSVGP